MFAFPGLARFTLTVVATQDARQGHGLAARCPKCHTLYEVTADVTPG
jgi:cytochrome c2